MRAGVHHRLRFTHAALRRSPDSNSIRQAQTDWRRIFDLGFSPWMNYTTEFHTTHTKPVSRVSAEMFAQWKSKRTIMSHRLTFFRFSYECEEMLILYCIQKGVMQYLFFLNAQLTLVLCSIWTHTHKKNNPRVEMEELSVFLIEFLSLSLSLSYTTPSHSRLFNFEVSILNDLFLPILQYIIGITLIKKLCRA